MYNFFSNSKKRASDQRNFSKKQIDIPENLSKHEIRKLIHENVSAKLNHAYIPSDKSKVYFCASSGYFFPAQVSAYKENPSKYIYISNIDAHYEIVSIINGKIFYEGISKDVSFCKQQLKICMAYDSREITLDVYNIDQKIVASWLDNAPSSININHLDEPIHTKIKPSFKFSLRRYDQRQKANKKIKTSYLIFLIVFLISAAYLLYGLFYRQSTLLQKNIQIMTTRKLIDKYQAYRLSLSQHATGENILSAILGTFEKLHAAYGNLVVVSEINYDSGKISYALSMPFIDRVNLFWLEKEAKDHHLNISLENISKPILSLEQEVRPKQQAQVTQITDVTHQVLIYINVLRDFYSSDYYLKYNVLRTVSFNRYKQTMINVSISNLTLQQLGAFLRYLDQYPARMIAFTIKLQGYQYNANFNIGFMGS